MDVKLTEAYLNTLNTMYGPVSASQLPDIKIDYKALMEYAENKGIPVIELSKSEIDQFVTPGKECQNV